MTRSRLAPKHWPAPKQGEELMRFTAWRAFIREKSGQDLIEYTLLLAFIALVGAGVYLGMGSTVSGIWTIANDRVAAANN